MVSSYALFAAVLCPLALMAQPAGPKPKVELLWPGGAPGAVGNEDADRPAISI